MFNLFIIILRMKYKLLNNVQGRGCSLKDWIFVYLVITALIMQLNDTSNVGQDLGQTLIHHHPFHYHHPSISKVN